MSLQQTEDVDESVSNSPSASNWTVLVRVGEETWHVGDAGNQKDDSTETASSDWEKAAKQFQRRSKYSFQFGYMLETWIRQLWVSGESLLTNHFFGRSSAASSRRSSSRRFRDSLQLGLIVGLVLGCFSLILFHQMVPAASAGKTNRNNVTTEHSASTAGGTIPLGSTALTIPAFHLYSLAVGSYSSQEKAASLQHNLQSKGIGSVVVRIGKNYSVLTGTSMYSGSLKQAESDLKKKIGTTPSITELNRPVTRIAASQSISSAQSKSVTAWLTSVVSSLNTITAAVQNGEPERDAKIAYDAAVKLTPSTKLLKQAGQGTNLISLKSDWQSAYDALSNKHQSAAEQGALFAYTTLIRLQNQN